jgi:Kef-type K+ transport system membrane component KefB
MLHLVYAASAAENSNVTMTTETLTAIVLILAVSALCGRLALRVGQPRVLGEMVAGVALGPSLLGVISPGAEKAIFGGQVKPALYLLSTIGLTLFMFLVGVGLEGESDRIIRHGKSGAFLAIAGFLPTLLLGVGTGYLLYSRLSLASIPRYEFALFLGGALSLTAFPMLARILYERTMQNTRLGRITLLAASIDDVVAWCFLALLIAMHHGSGLSGGLRTVGLVAAFAAFMLLAVYRLLRPLGAHAGRTGRLGFDWMYLVITLALLSGLVTEKIGIYSIFGGFIAGLCMPRNKAFRDAIHGSAMELTCVLLLPMFFTFSGLSTKLDTFGGLAIIAPLILILAAAFSGKYVGCSVSMRAMGFSWRESCAVGSLMNSRGLMILIFINIGLEQQIITQRLFSMLVVVAVVTTAAAVPLYRWSLPGRLERQMRAAGASGRSDVLSPAPVGSVKPPRPLDPVRSDGATVDL